MHGCHERVAPSIRPKPKALKYSDTQTLWNAETRSQDKYPKPEALRYNKRTMPRVLDVRARDASPTKGVSRVLLNPVLADLFRRVCNHLDKGANEVFEEMLVLYLRERTNLEPVYGEETAEEEVRRRRASQAAKDNRREELIAAGQRIDAEAPQERRKAERRTKKGSAALYPADQNRRKSGERRKG